MMKLKEFKPNDIIDVVIDGCMSGTGRITEVYDNAINFQWLEKSFACDCMHSAGVFCEVTQDDIEHGIVNKLELLERPNAAIKRLYITDDQVKDIVELYETNKEDLMAIENEIEENGCLDDGVTNACDSFEQGYNNALEQVMKMLEIPFTYE